MVGRAASVVSPFYSILLVGNPELCQEGFPRFPAKETFREKNEPKFRENLFREDAKLEYLAKIFSLNAKI